MGQEQVERPDRFFYQHRDAEHVVETDVYVLGAVTDMRAAPSCQKAQEHDRSYEHQHPDERCRFRL